MSGDYQQLQATALRLVAAYDPELDGPAEFSELEAAVKVLLDMWRPRP